MSLSKFSLLRARALSATLKSMGLLKESGAVLSIFKISQDVGKIIDQNSHVLFVFDNDFLGNVSDLAKIISGSESNKNLSEDTMNAVSERFRAFKVEGNYSIDAGTIFTIKKATIDAIKSSPNATEEFEEEVEDVRIVPAPTYENKLINISEDFEAPTEGVSSIYGEQRDKRPHLGIDYRIAEGEDIRSIGNGIVIGLHTGATRAYIDDEETIPAAYIIYPSLKSGAEKITEGTPPKHVKTKIDGVEYTVADANKKIKAAGGGYGNYVEIAHGITEKNNKRYLITSYYAHLSKVSVEKEAVVSKGSVIGKSGSTGQSTGPHLHLEIRGYLLEDQQASPRSFNDLMSLEASESPVRSFAKDF